MTTRPLILGTAGHIDHGKTALVKALTGIDTDRLEEEKQRGISIDIGFAHLDLGDRQLGIVDVPGHERFVRNMLAGASGVDLALLVIAADDSVMPQTREHLAILELLQIKCGLIALTKIDLVEPDWLDLVEADIHELVEDTFLAGAPIVRTSVAPGGGSEYGIDALRNTIETMCGEVEQDEVGDRFRMAIDRSFVLQGLGTVVTGTVWSGSAHVGDELELLPEARPARVRSLQSHGADVETITKGQRAAINLMGAHHSEIERGFELAAPGFLKPSRRLTVHLRALPDSPWPIKHRAHVRLHLGTQEIMAEVRLLHDNALAPGQVGFGQLITEEPMIASGLQPFVIRTESPVRTIGGGQVLQPIAPRLRRNEPSIAERLEKIRSGDERSRSDSTIYFYGLVPWTLTDLCRDAKLTQARAETIVSELLASGTIAILDLPNRTRRHLHRDVKENVTTRMIGEMQRLHDAHPLEQAIPRRRLTARLDYLPADVLLGLVNHLIERGQLAGDEQTIALPNFKPSLTDAQLTQSRIVIDAFQEAGFSPPDLADLARAAGVSEKKLRPILDLCVSEGKIVHVEGSMFLHADWHDALRRRITEALADSAGMTMSEIRQILDTSRKYAVPICEHLDRIGLTKRQGDVRVLKHPVAAQG